MKLNEQQLKFLRLAEEGRWGGGVCVREHRHWRTLEALRRRKLVRRINKSRNWRFQFYTPTVAGSALLEGK